MSPSVSAAFAQHGVCVNCRCGGSRRSRQHWDLNPPANSPRGTQRSLLLITLQRLPWPLGERPNPPPGRAVSAPAPASAFRPHRGRGLASSKPSAPSCLRAFAHACPASFLPQLPFRAQLAWHLLELVCPGLPRPGWALLVDATRLAPAFSSLPTSFVINCEASASPTRQ